MVITMNKESLELVKSKLVDVLEDSNIDSADKIELALNIWLFLEPVLYDDNIKVLSKYGKKRVLNDKK